MEIIPAQFTSLRQGKYRKYIQIAFVALCYYVSASIGDYLTFMGVFSTTQYSPYWPPSGVALALVLIYGPSVWPGIAIGSLLLTPGTYWFNENPDPLGIVTIASFFTLGRVIEPLVGSILLIKWNKGEKYFSNAQNAYVFILVTFSISFIGSGLSSFSIYISELDPFDVFFKKWLLWYIDNVVGILLFTPLVLGLYQYRSMKFPLKKLAELVLILTGLFILYFGVLPQSFLNTLTYALPFLVLPLLLWLAFQYQMIGTITGVTLISFIAIYHTVHGEGPFVIMETAQESVLLLQSFLVIISTSTLVLSSTVQERIKAQNNLQHLKGNLENLIDERAKRLMDEINNRKTMENHLLVTNEELVKRNAELDNFAYSVSHDLRAPIATILGLVNLAKNDVHGLENYIEMIQKNAVRLDEFIKAILDQSRNYRIDITKEKIEFYSLIEETIASQQYTILGDLVLEKKLNISQQKPFYSDTWRLKIVFNNLVSNAIQYRKGNHVKISVNIVFNDQEASIEFSDTGKGIDPEHMDKIFQMFYRGTHTGSGSGLGLYIVSEAIKKLNGSIQVNSALNKGTTFIIKIPNLENTH